MTEKLPAPETCTQTGHAYKVEVRAVGRPVQIGNELIGNEWRSLPTVDTFPHGASHRDAADVLTYTHNYFGAIALAASAMSSMTYGIETRIAKYRRVVKYELHREGEQILPDMLALMFADGDRHRERVEQERKELEAKP